MVYVIYWNLRVCRNYSLLSPQFLFFFSFSCWKIINKFFWIRVTLISDIPWSTRTVARASLIRWYYVILDLLPIHLFSANWRGLFCLILVRFVCISTASGNIIFRPYAINSSTASRWKHNGNTGRMLVNTSSLLDSHAVVNSSKTVLIFIILVLSLLVFMFRPDLVVSFYTYTHTRTW